MCHFTGVAAQDSRSHRHGRARHLALWVVAAGAYLVGALGLRAGLTFDSPIFWLPPAHPITAGTALSANQLNASAQSAGTLTYDPAAGVVLPVGEATLRVYFTPTGASAPTATAEVPLVVNPADGPTILEQPAVQRVGAGGSGQFTFRVGSGVTGYRWQTTSDLAFTWSDLADNPQYAGTGTATLTVKNMNEWLNGTRYRCVAAYAGGKVTSNLTMLFYDYPPTPETVVYAGGYSGTFSGGGHWAMYVGAPSRFIGYLAARRAAIETTFTYQADGTFQFSCPESNGAEVVNTLTLSGAITAPSQGVRLVNAQLQGTGETLSGAFPRTGGLTMLSGNFFTAVAIGTIEGKLHVVVGYDGTTDVVILTSAFVDGAHGTIQADGTASFITEQGRSLQLALNLSTRTVSATLGTAATATSAGRSRSVAAVQRVPTAMEFVGVAQSVTTNRRLANIATRAYCGAGNSVSIGGFVVTGSLSKRVLIRAVGPSLTPALPAGEVLDDPVLKVHDARRNNAEVALNDDWGTNANAADITATAARVGAQPLTASDTRSAALLLTLDPGVYTCVVSGKNGAAGVVLLEAYDADSTGMGARFVDIATRAQAGSGNKVTIGGFVVDGNVPKQVLLRAVGPTLATLGLGAAEVLADPVMELHDGSQGNAIIATNDNWTDDGMQAKIAAVGARVGAWPFDGADTKSAGMLITLKPGPYTFIVRDKNDRDGVVLAEVYDAD